MNPKQADVEIAENDAGFLKKREFIKVGGEHLFLNKNKIYCQIPKYQRQENMPHHS